MRALIVYKNENNEVLRYRGHNRSVGGIKTRVVKEAFSNQEIFLTKGDCFYLSSDGYIPFCS